MNQMTASAQFAVGPNHAWTGSRYVDVTAPRPEDISAQEIAVGLARETRYGAACTDQPWSVAQHSLLTVHQARKDGVTEKKALRVLLLHDAPEYMLRDLLRPVKLNCPDYQALENRWWAAIAARFDLPIQMPDIVKHYDNIALGLEKLCLISPRAGDWPGIPGREELKGREIPDRLLDAAPKWVAQEFLIALGELSV